MSLGVTEVHNKHKIHLYNRFSYVRVTKAQEHNSWLNKNEFIPRWPSPSLSNLYFMATKITWPAPTSRSPEETSRRMQARWRGNGRVPAGNFLIRNVSDASKLLCSAVVMRFWYSDRKIYGLLVLALV